MKWLTLLICILLSALVSTAQFTLEAVVKDAETHLPLNGVSVYINNSSIGTLSGDGGKFRLTLPVSRAEVIFTMVGYETKQVTVSAGENNTEFLMKKRVAQLESVLVQAPMADGWEKWGQFFLDNFIGKTTEASSCDLKNHKTLKFFFDRKANTLMVTADEPLVLVNNALGYKVQYDLQDFYYDGRSRVVYYAGYPFFTPLKGGAAKQEKWAANRRECYSGSTMHFFRSLFRNMCSENGFIIQPAVYYANPEKKRVKQVMRQRIESGQLSLDDSAGYYRNVMQQEDSLFRTGKPIPADSVAFAINPHTAGLEFEDYLLITYMPKKIRPDIRQLLNDFSGLMASYVKLQNPEALEIQADGSYYSPLNFMVRGYWSQSEKMGRMLPFDYKEQ